MEIDLGIQSVYYSRIYILFIFFLCCLTSVKYAQQTNDIIYKEPNVPLSSIALTITLVVFLGYRPIDYYFGDTPMYAHFYNNFAYYLREADFSSEWIWKNLNFYCSFIGLSVNDFFLLVSFLYIGLMAFACYRLFPNNLWISILFIFSSFSFYSFGVNGIRNGLACSILMLSFSEFNNNNIYIKTLLVLLMVIALGIHRSSLLPITCFFIAIFQTTTRISLIFWLFSIFFSLAFGNVIGDFFQSLNLFEDKSNYFQDAVNTEVSGEFSRTGFRWDFLLYSAMPVIMIYYSTIKRNFEDKTYTLLSNIYLTSNAFWIMVIRASFSNRFAYLSWFLYPLIISYPLLKFNLSKKQDLITSIILLMYSGFTLFMFLIH